MWLFSQNGMFSIVADSHSDEHLIVRSRVKGDIEKYWPYAVVERRDDADYLYRAPVPKAAVAEVVAAMVNDINYGNFKDSIRERRRVPFYLRVWEAMIDMQETFKDEEYP